MASIKISELNELTNVDNADILPIVDSSANETKKITYNNLVMSNSAVITGSFSVNKNSHQRYTSISYPSGFTKDNSVVVSVGTQLTGYSSWVYADYGGTGIGYNYEDELAIIITLSTSTLSIDMANKSSSYDLSGTYKLVLMKIS